MALIFGIQLRRNVPTDRRRSRRSNADRIAFLNATGAYAGGSLGGLDNVDLWIGGLAEEGHAVRRHAGLDLQFRVRSPAGKASERRPLLLPAAARRPASVREMENNSFAAMIMRNADAGHLPSDVFSTPGLIMTM